MKKFKKSRRRLVQWLGRFHLSAMLAFILNPWAAGGVILLIFTGLAWMLITYLNNGAPAEMPVYNP
jgi:hypothetical protein